VARSTLAEVVKRGDGELARCRDELAQCKEERDVSRGELSGCRSACGPLTLTLTLTPPP
jgi:hypothetical protein